MTAQAPWLTSGGCGVWSGVGGNIVSAAPKVERDGRSRIVSTVVSTDVKRVLVPSW